MQALRKRGGGSRRALRNAAQRCAANLAKRHVMPVQSPHMPQRLACLQGAFGVRRGSKERCNYNWLGEIEHWYCGQLTGGQREKHSTAASVASLRR
jgi:hypothetical protein